uniref:Warthog protein 4 n=2 Tax=Ascaris TaxID=6251 RepID=F1L3I9_ASCSU
MMIGFLHSFCCISSSMKSTLWLLVYTSVPIFTFASYCGQSTIPFSFQVLSNGQPVLGCARPSCFGWTAYGDKAADSPWFYRIAKKQDGFLRKSDIGRLQKIISGGSYTPQISDCEKDYESSSCDGDDEWVGGIGASTNIPNDALKLRCCKYDKLRAAWDRGLAEVARGEIVVGGEVTRDGRQYAFDYIANIRKRIQSDGNVSYDVLIRRFVCLPPFTEGILKVDSGARFMFADNGVDITISEENASEKTKGKSLSRGDDGSDAIERRSRFGQYDETKRKVRVIYQGTPEYEEVSRRLRQQIRNAKHARAHGTQLHHRRITPDERYSLSRQQSHATETEFDPQQLPVIRTIDVERHSGSTQNFVHLQPSTSSRARAQQQPLQHLPKVAPPSSHASLVPLQQTHNLLPTLIQQQPPVTFAPSLRVLFPQSLQQPLLFGLPQQQYNLWSQPQLQLPALLQYSYPNRASNPSPLDPLAIVP